MRRLTAPLVLCVALSAAATPLAAQERSPIVDLIARARRALDDLEYARADSIARSLLEMGGRATQQQRITGLQLMAAALYPEEQAAQQPDSAVRYLGELVRATRDSEVPQAISWPGLDSLLASVRRTTFAVWAEPDSRYELVAVEAEGRIEVAASRPARFRLTAVAAGESREIVLDSSGPAPDASLRIRAVAGDRLVLRWGRYTLHITGVDTLSGERIELAFAATVDAPPFELLVVPIAIDPALLRAERAPRRPVRNALLGLGLGAATAFVTAAFGGSDAVGSASSSNRGYVVGAGMTLGALIGALADRGARLRANVEHNARVREDFARHARDMRAENARRRMSYRAIITIESSVR